MTETKMITITMEEYELLLDDSIFLACLHDVGVDNWDYYGEAISEYNRQNQERFNN